MEITLERNDFCDPIATATPTFVTVPDSSMTLLTLCDVRKLSKFKMATTTSGFYNRHLEFQ
jgi:hypothetical protein